MTGIRVELQLKDGSFVSGMIRAGQSVSSFQKELARLDPHFAKMAKGGDHFVTSIKKADERTLSLSQSLGKVGVAAGLAAVALGGLIGTSGGFVGDIIRINAEMERLRFQMIGMSTSSDPIKEAARNVEYLREAATRAPFSFKELTSTFVKLKASGIDPLDGSMQSLVDGIAAMGGTDEQLHRVTLGVTQMMGKGVIQMEEMRQQLGESMPNAMRIMARSMGVSVAELTAAIATGRLAAKPALDAFSDELDRTYGGEAQRMMETFSGQVSKMFTNFQNLATGKGVTEGGMVSFFDAQKTALRDFNAFLESDAARDMAKGFGEAMATLVNWGRVAVETLYEFRGEIMAITKALAAGLGIKYVAGLIGSLAAQATLGSASMRALYAAIAQGASMISLGATGLTSMSTALVGAQYAALGFGTVIAGIGRAVSMAAPWLAALGTAVYLLGEKFGWFGDKTAQAYEELKKFGAESRKQAEDILAAREAILLENVEDAQSAYDWDLNAPRYKTDKLDAIEAAKNSLEDFRAERDKILNDASNNEVDSFMRGYDDEIALREREIQAQYREDAVNLDEKFKTEQQKAKENGRAIAEINKEYHDEQQRIREKEVQGYINIYQGQIDTLKQMAETASGDEKKRLEAQLFFLRGKIIDARKEMESITGVGLDFADPVEDQASKIAKGSKLLADLEEDIVGLKDGLSGASGEFAKLQNRIARGDFGSIEEGGEVVAQLHQNLLDAAAAKEALDFLMTGKKKLDGDIESLRMKVLEDELRLQEELAGKQLTDAERIRMRIEQGYYQGFGPVDKVRGAIMSVIGAMTIQGEAANELGAVMQENTFGNPTVLKIDQVTEAIQRLSQGVIGLNGVLAGTSFSAFDGSALGGGGMGGGWKGLPASAGMLDLIGAAEGTDKGRGYNETLDYGRWTGGPVDLVRMTINEVLALQDKMRTPENRAMYGNGKGSSAVGRYQIVSETLRSLMAQMGLKGDELFDEKMQDSMAYRLLAGRGLNHANLGNEWVSLKNVPFERIQQAWNASASGPTIGAAAGMKPAATTASTAQAPTFNADAIKARVDELVAQQMAQQSAYYAEIDELQTREEKNVDTAAKVARKNALDELRAKTKAASTETENLGENYRRLLEMVESGKLGKNTDINSEEYRDLVKAAKDLDDVEKQLKDKRQASRAAAEDEKRLKEEALDLDRRIAEERARAKDPNYKGQSDDLRRLTADLDEYIENVRIAHGTDSEEYKKALQRKSDLLGKQTMLDAETRRADLESERQDIEDSLMSQGQLRATEYRRKLAEIEAWEQQARAAGMREVEIVETVERMKAALRQQYQQETNPLTQTMEEWKDISATLMSSTSGWAENLASGISGLITGTGSLKSAVDGMLNDLVNSSTKYIMQHLFGDKMTSAAGKMAGPMAGGKKAVGIAHTGGIVGNLRLGKMVNPGVFVGAKKFHSGGIIGSNLLPSEVPIIAKKGEGVFTPEQMKSMGGSNFAQSISINAPVTVNGSGGTSEQNDDLARKMSQQLESTMRATVIDELRRQMRPGNMMGGMIRK